MLKRLLVPSRSRRRRHLCVEVLESRQVLDSTPVALAPIPLPAGVVGETQAAPETSSAPSRQANSGSSEHVGVAREGSQSRSGRLGGASRPHQAAGDGELRGSPPRQRSLHRAAHAADHSPPTDRVGDRRPSANGGPREAPGGELSPPPLEPGGATGPPVLAEPDGSPGRMPWTADEGAGNGGAGDDALLPALPPVRARWAAEPQLSAFIWGGADFGRDASHYPGADAAGLRRVALEAAASLPRQQRAGAESPVSPHPSGTALPEPLPSPQAAGLLAHGLPFGLAALDRAIRALTEPEGAADYGGSALVHWLGLASWLLGAGLAYAVARGRSSLPAPALLGRGLSEGRDLSPENLP